MKKAAVFLDRDGVINKEVHLLKEPNKLELIENSAQAISLLNKNNIPVIVVSNQPVVARGLCTKEDVKKTNDRLKELLKQHNAHIDAIYCCFHHPKHGNEKYKIDCNCRKPKPGLLIKAQKEHNIDLKNSFIVGDRTSDIKAGDLAGCKTIGVRTGYACDDGFKDATPQQMANDLYHAVQIILKEWEK